ncbi:hypothetical protein CFP56_024855 [Quercus suber]|uniref:Uncharacterized protein n=1 Tax=Quercus suber TaxID=58331 RepID=A0AAW0K5M1_QUESU
MEKLQMYEEVHHSLAERFISVCWGIWKERNVIRTGGRGKPSRVTLKTSLSLMDEFHVANKESCSSHIERACAQDMDVATIS